MRPVARSPVLLTATLALGVSVAAAVTIGVADLSVGQVFRTLAVHAGLPVTPLPVLADSIVWDLRLPRVVLAGLVGGGLAVCGAVLQALTRNPLADPYLLGISAGASTGAMSVLVFGLGAGAAALSTGAFLGSIAAFGVALLLAGRRWTEPARILLAGVAVGQLFSAVTSLIVVADASAQTTRSITFWLLGSLTGASWPTVGKTPLAALRIRLENLEPAVAEDARRGLAAALTEADRLADMVETLLRITRAEHIPERPALADLDEVIARRIALWEPMAGRRNVRLALTGGPAGEVDAVTGALDQILENLLANALRAAPDESTITVHRCHAPHSPDSPDEPVVELHVIDQGAGLTEEQRRQAFDPFWRAPGAPKGGTGLGLALVRQLTEAGGGQVDLHPAAGGGIDAVVRLRAATRPG